MIDRASGKKKSNFMAVKTLEPCSSISFFGSFRLLYAIETLNKPSSNTLGLNGIGGKNWTAQKGLESL